MDYGIFTGRDERHVNVVAGTGRGAGTVMRPRRSVAARMAPAAYPDGGETITAWTPFYATAVHPYVKGMPYSMTAYGQASGFTDSTDPDHQPTHPLASWPGGSMQDGVERVTPGKGRILYNDAQLPQVGPTPNMVFVPPLSYGFQTPPLYALGLP